MADSTGNNIIYVEGDCIDAIKSASLALGEIENTISSASTMNGIDIGDSSINSTISGFISKVDAISIRITNLNTAIPEMMAKLANVDMVDFYQEKIIEMYDINISSYTDEELKEYSAEILQISESFVNYLISEYGYEYAEVLGLEKVKEKTLLKFKEAGMDEETRSTLDQKMYQILSPLFYTREGVIAASYLYSALTASYGFVIGYERGSYFTRDNEFYFGRKADQLGALDCINYLKQLYRSVGLDPWAGSARSFLGYATKSNTDKDLVGMTYEDGTNSKYTTGQAGDILSSEEHIMMIVGNDGKGYYYVESANWAGHYSYATYESLDENLYKVTVMDSLYNNTSTYADETCPKAKDNPGWGWTHDNAGRYGENIYIPSSKYLEVFGIDYPDAASDPNNVAATKIIDAQFGKNNKRDTAIDTPKDDTPKDDKPKDDKPKDDTPKDDKPKDDKPKDDTPKDDKPKDDKPKDDTPKDDKPKDDKPTPTPNPTPNPGTPVSYTELNAIWNSGNITKSVPIVDFGKSGSIYMNNESGFIYGVDNVTIDQYGNYMRKLIANGFDLTTSGMWTNGTQKLMITYSNDDLIISIFPTLGN